MRLPTRRREVESALLGSVTGALVVIGFITERFHVWMLVVALLSLGGLIWVANWWPGRRALCLTLAANVLLVFLYLWSLDDHVTVVIRENSSGYTAIVGSSRVVLRQAAVPGRVGLYAGSLLEYHVGPTDESFDFADYNQRYNSGGYVQPSMSFPARFGQWMRLAVPRPAWSSVRIQERLSIDTVATVSIDNPVGGTGWTVNPRGEQEGTPGSAIVLAHTLAGPYSMSADLYRPDGTQGILVDIDSQGRGFLLAVRMDQPDLVWYRWDGGRETATLSSSSLHVELIGMVQRDVRLVLGNAIAALILLLLAPLIYLLTRLIMSRPGGGADDLAPFVRSLERSRVHQMVALGIALAGLIAAGLVSTFLLDRIPHIQDSVAYLFQAKTLALGHLSVPAPPSPPFFRHEFIVVHDGQWFGKYPPGWPLLLAVGVWTHAAWLVNPVLTAANLGLIYRIGREIYGPVVGLTAGILALSSPFLLFLGGSYMAHTATNFYLLAFAYLLIRWVQRQRSGTATQDWSLLVPAGFLLGMAFLTRQLDTIGFAAPLGLVLSWPECRRRWPEVRWLVAGAFVPVLALLLYNRHFTGSPWITAYSLTPPFDKLGFDWMGGPAGFGVAQGLFNTSLNLQALLAHLFGWPFYLTLALALLPFLAGRATRWDAILGLSALGVIVAYAFFWMSALAYGPRYFAAAAPWVILLTARGFQELFRWPLRLPLRVRPDRLAALLMPMLLAIALLGYNLSVYLPAQMPVYGNYNFVTGKSVEAVGKAGIRHALVFVVSHPADEWWSYGEVFSSNDPLLRGDVIYARDLGADDRRLMAAFPGRSYFRLDFTTVTRIKP